MDANGREFKKGREGTQRAQSQELFPGLFVTTSPKVGGGNVHFSSATDEWPTPQDFFDRVNSELGPFELDPCATAENAKCPRFFTKEDNGLARDWAPARVWMNPPYGRTIWEWMRKAWVESQRGAFVVCLVPARTDTRWWHDYASKGEIRFCKGRLKFGGHVNSAPFPSALVIFQPLETHE